MAGAAVTYLQDDRKVRGKLAAMIKRMGSPEPGLAIIGEIGRTSIVRNFEEGGRPGKWPESKAKHGGKTLVKQGFAGGLVGSISPVVQGNVLVIGTNKIYAAIHNFGGVIKPKKGKALAFKIGGKTVFAKQVKIPQREFMVIQDEDKAEMVEALGDFIINE
jgi:phage gpG-like protein